MAGVFAWGCVLKGDDRPYFKLASAEDVRDVLTNYAKASGPHCNAVRFGDARHAAELLNADFVEV